jgi:AmiR/NasT family two-component response regulator
VRPFQNSLEALALVAVRATGARSYSLFENGCAAQLDATAPAIVEYPLRSDSAIAATVVFAFGSEAEALRAKPRLARVAAAMQAICSVAAADRYAHLAGQISDLEARLMDSKIADRAQGILADETNSDPTGVIARHVDSVLRPTAARRFLEQVLAELEDEMEERWVVGQAKQVLQALDKLSEEQAHHHLRILSRKSRKPLKDVAQQLIDDQYPIVRFS